MPWRGSWHKNITSGRKWATTVFIISHSKSWIKCFRLVTLTAQDVISKLSVIMYTDSHEIIVSGILIWPSFFFCVRPENGSGSVVTPVNSWAAIFEPLNMTYPSLTWLIFRTRFFLSAHLARLQSATNRNYWKPQQSLGQLWFINLDSSNQSWGFRSLLQSAQFLGFLPPHLKPVSNGKLLDICETKFIVSTTLSS